MCCVITFPSLQVVLAPCAVSLQSLQVVLTPCAVSLHFPHSKLSSLHVLQVIKFPSYSMCCVITFPSLQVVLAPCAVSLLSLTPSCPGSMCLVIKFPSLQVVLNPCAVSLNVPRTPCAVSLHFPHSKLSWLHVLCHYISITPSCPHSMCCVITFPSLQVVLTPCAVSLNFPRTPCAVSLHFPHSKLSSLHVLCRYIFLTPSCPHSMCRVIKLPSLYPALTSICCFINIPFLHVALSSLVSSTDDPQENGKRMSN